MQQFSAASKNKMAKRTIGILYNPISGKGRGRINAEMLQQQLEGAGFAVDLRQSQPRYQALELESFLGAIQTLVVCGGDGTLQGAVEQLIRTPVPVYLCPSGNQSLFAREHRMTAEGEEVIRRIESGNAVSHRVSRAGGKCFLSMVSIGFDAEVVAELSRRRSGLVNNWSYAAAVRRVWPKYKAPQISLRIDGTQVLDRQQGMLVAARCRQYALGLKLVPEADQRSEQLALRFFPHQSPFGLLPWAISAWCGTIERKEEGRLFYGRELDIETQSAVCAVQADGELIGQTPIKVSAGDESISVLGE